MESEFNKTLVKIAKRVARTLEFIPDDIKQKCEEIRLRVNLPLCLTVDGKVMFVSNDGNVSSVCHNNCFVVEKEDINHTLLLLCNNSVYLHESEIKQGFISVEGGCRAGVCGCFNADGMLTTVNSINLRIARQIFNISMPILPYAENGLLIAGPPASGKTTMLRDIIRLLSNGKNGCYRRISVIDSRSEISGGVGVFDIGVNTDVLYTQNKALGTQIALRTMFPDIIAFDEIGTFSEFNSVCSCFNAGVKVITTAHCLDKRDLIKREITKKIIESGGISYIVLLGKKLGETPQILDVKEVKSSVYS